MNIIKFESLLFFLLLSNCLKATNINNCLYQTINPIKAEKYIKGGQFKDLILPVPIVGELKHIGIWGGKNVLPRDVGNGVEDNEWCYWGGNPMKDKYGKYHIEVCRWPESKGHFGWFNSEVAHCVSESGNPLGPYKVTGTIIKKGHNPEVIKLNDSTYALHLMTSEVYTSKSLDGEWKLLGKMSMNPRGFKNTSVLGPNLTTTLRPDGSILLMTKGGDVAISRNSILGTYDMVSLCNYKRNSGYAEDPVVWRSVNQYHCIYNHAQDKVSGYMRSLDGIHWKNEDGIPYDVSSIYYTDGNKNEWYKFERPKIVQDSLGRACFLSLAVIDIPKNEDIGNDNHSSKNTVIPLVKEKLIFITNKKLDSSSKNIEVLMKAENGFSPSKDVDMNSLIFGSDSFVNYGKGCKVESWDIKENGDILLRFKGETGLNVNDYDLKMIGKQNNGELIIGYAILPDKSELCASLIALPPVCNNSKIECVIQNMGLSISKSTKASLYVYNEKERDKIKTITIPPLQAYESFNYTLPLKNEKLQNCEYQLVIEEDNYYNNNWMYVDNNYKSVHYMGKWGKVINSKYFLGSQNVSQEKGSSVIFTFNGTRARVYGTLENSFGSFDVYIDNEFIENIRLSWGGAKAKIYQTKILKKGRHTLELKLNDYQNNCKGSIDFFSYENH